MDSKDRCDFSSVLCRTAHIWYLIIFAIFLGSSVYYFNFSNIQSGIVFNSVQPLPVKLDFAFTRSLDDMKPIQINNKDGFVFIIRTFNGFLPQTERLLHDIAHQANVSDNFQIHAVLLPTDSESIDTLYNSTKYWSSLFPNIHLSYHNVSKSVYDENCCQVQTMCTDKRYKQAWMPHLKSSYGHYKHFNDKKRTFCKGNNLLHYILTDLAVKSVMEKYSNCKYITITNGDNSYNSLFIKKTVDRLKEVPNADIVMVDYLERGKELVHTSIKHMDLGAFVYRIDSLRRFNALFLDALPPDAWPDHYYGADSLYIKHVIANKLAVVVKQGDVLFVHW